MKLNTKLILALTMIVSANTFASTAYYGLPKQPVVQTANKAALTSYVAVYNYTYDIYTVHAVFLPKGTVVQPDYTLDVYHSPMGIITYQIEYPDTLVCLQVVRNFDHFTVFPRDGQNSCLASGNVNIGPYKSANRPTVAITH